MSLDHEKVRRFYDSKYHVNGRNDARLPWHARRVAARLGDLREKMVLDVACGGGEWLAELARRGASVSGVDISKVAVQRCRELLPGSEFHEAIAEQLPFDSNRFDLVTCLGSLEHFLDQHAAIEEMRRVAKPDGRILILVPNAGFLTRRLGLYSGTQQSAIRETVRSIQEWQAMFEAGGLSVEARWRDLHVLNGQWIRNGSMASQALRLLQASMLPIWPLSWQYQIYFLCKARPSHPSLRCDAEP
jgi:2-polyprenyl-3-methyl-5-hydroxy-6-metoxy-1,4-benzoquinol methylase